MVKKKNEGETSKQRIREKIEKDTRDFLNSGGEITVIPAGQSGVSLIKPGQKQIKLGNTK